MTKREYNRLKRRTDVLKALEHTSRLLMVEMPESLSRLLQRLTDAGLLAWTGRSVSLSASLWERI